MINVHSTREIEAAIHELVGEWNLDQRFDLARNYSRFASPSACWTSGSEFLQELEIIIDETIASTPEMIKEIEMAQLLRIKQVIKEWFEFAAMNSTRQPPANAKEYPGIRITRISDYKRV
jgi:hypothetical protein